MKQFKKLIAAVEAAAIIIASFFISYFDLLYFADSAMRDIVYQSPRGINNKIKIIAIDDRSLDELGPFSTWTRQIYADTLNILGDYPAAAALDIMFFGEMDEAGDKAFADEIAAHDNVILGSYIDYSTVVEYDENGTAYINDAHIDVIHEPYCAAQTGFVNCSSDADGTVRSISVSVSAPELYGDKVFDSFALTTYRKYCEKLGISPVSPATDSLGRMWIAYSGRPNDYEHISICDILAGRVDPKIFTDCIVIIGPYAAGMQDQYHVPNSSALMYGAEIHANIIQGMIDRKYPVPADRLAASLVCAVLAAAVFAVSGLIKRFAVSTPISAVLIAGYIAAGILLFDSGTAMPLIYAPLFMLISYLLNLGVRYIEEALEKRRIANAFRKYVAPQVVEEISRKGGYSIKLGGENRSIAVLFVDIRGFTPLSESLEPEQVVDILNEYLNLTTNAIFKNGGTLDKFIGDATMAVFNAPFDLDDYVFRAVKTAWDILRGGAEIESTFMEKYGKSVAFGVGVNCGNAVVGNIGCDFRMDYTAIGDTVNTAARLEANAKRGQAYISEAVYEQVRDRVTVEPVGEIPLKGKSKGVFVYSLTGIKE